MQRITLTLVLAAILVLGLAPASEAGIINVDCLFGPIQPQIAGAGSGDVIVIHPSGCSAGFVLNGLSNVQVVGADVPAGYSGAYPGGLGTPHPFNPAIYDNTSTCVTILNSDNISIVGLWLEFCNGNGFTIENSTDIHIGGNSLLLAAGFGIETRASERVEIFGNYLYGASSPGYAGIYIDPLSPFAQIHDNRVAKNWFGIVVEGKLTNVTLNEVFGNQDLGVYVSSPLSNVLRNTVRDNGAAGSAQIVFPLYPSPDETCVVGNDTGGAGIAPPFGCQAENN